MEDGDISIMDGGGITELDPAGDRLLVDISGFADEWLLRSSLVRRSKCQESVHRRKSSISWMHCAEAWTQNAGLTSGGKPSGMLQHVVGQ